VSHKVGRNDVVSDNACREKADMNIRRREGQSLVEFALVLPLLIILVFGIIDFSIGLYDKAVITNASREGARAGVMYYSNPTTLQPLDSVGLQSAVTTVVGIYCSTNLVTFGAAATPSVTFPLGLPTPDPVTGYSGLTLTVTVTYKYAYSVIPSFIPGLSNPTLTATTKMRME
jgi:Flp pilus assembly protein TadG